MVVDALTGNVGIGTDSPASRLTVAGNVQVVDPSNTGLRVQTNTAGGKVASFGGNGDFQVDANGTVAGRFVVKEDGKVGIGVAAPITSLHLRKDAAGALGPILTLMNGGSLAGAGAAIDFDGYDTGANPPTARIQSVDDGNFSSHILFLTKTPGASGNALVERVTVTSTGTLKILTLGSAGGSSLCYNAFKEIAACSSSLRYKESVAPFRPGLDLVGRLRPVAFNWKQGGERDLGFVAEEVSEAEPLLVTRNSAGEVEGVKYDRLSAVLVNAVREQQDQIKEQQQQLRAKDARIADIEARLASLERGLGRKKRATRRGR